MRSKKNSILLLLFLSICISACKKDKTTKAEEFKGITQTQGGKLASVFEFSSGVNPKNIIYNAVVPYNTGTILLKIKYQLTYKGQTLSSAHIESMDDPVNVDYSTNAKNLIIGSDFQGKRNNIIYTYDNQNRLISSSGWGTNYEYLYNASLNLEKVIIKNPQGVKWLEVAVTSDDLINPLMGIPLVYLEEDMPMWTWFSLSKHNITSLTYTYCDPSGNITETIKYIYSYTYQNDMPLTMKRYIDTEFLKGDKGYFDGFTYNY